MTLISILLSNVVYSDSSNKEHFLKEKIPNGLLISNPTCSCSIGNTQQPPGRMVATGC